MTQNNGIFLSTWVTLGRVEGLGLRVWGKGSRRVRSRMFKALRGGGGLFGVFGCRMSRV